MERDRIGLYGLDWTYEGAVIDVDERDIGVDEVAICGNEAVGA